METGDREMILFSREEIQDFLGSLECYVLTPSKKIVNKVTLNRSPKIIESSVLCLVMSPSKINLDNINFEILRYVIPRDQALRSELKDLYDMAFRLEIERVPTIIHDFPEVAKWRLRIGK
jgi:hypothetical protein